MWADISGWIIDFRGPLEAFTAVVKWEAVGSMMTLAAVIAALRAARSSAKAAQAERIARAKLVLVYTAKFYRTITSHAWSLPAVPDGPRIAKALIAGGAMQRLLNDLGLLHPKEMPNTTMVDLLLASRTWMDLMISVVDDASRAQKINNDIYQFGPRGAQLCGALGDVVRKMGGHAERFDDDDVKLWLPPWYRLFYNRLFFSWLFVRSKLADILPPRSAG